MKWALEVLIFIAWQGASFFEDRGGLFYPALLEKRRAMQPGGKICASITGNRAAQYKQKALFQEPLFLRSENRAFIKNKNDI